LRNIVNIDSTSVTLSSVAVERRRKEIQAQTLLRSLHVTWLTVYGTVVIAFFTVPLLLLLYFAPHVMNKDFQYWCDYVCLLLSHFSLYVFIAVVELYKN